MGGYLIWRDWREAWQEGRENTNYSHVFFAVFVSFDRKAVRLITDMGANAMLLEVKNNS